MNTMSASRPCPQCGALIPAGASEGLCPRCLLALNLATQSHMAGDTRPPGSGPVTPPTLEEVAKLFPQLEILRLIGIGGMGAVYQARQPALDRHVALKLLHTPPADDPGFAERFAQEARALAKLNHPNIVALHESGQVDGRPYFLMEFVDGVNLRQLQQAGRLSPREALQIVPQVCDALQYAHDEGIVHRDIKPENVLIDRKGRVKVADFGLAKLMGRETAVTRLTGAGHVMGTPHYMAPEQVEHPLDVDHRADIFSLGVVFYELLTGELPLGRFAAPSKKVRIDVRLDEVVLRALEKEPALRYQQASILKTQMETIAGTPAVVCPSVMEAGQFKRVRGQILTGSFSLALMAAGMAINITPFQPYGLAILIWGVLLAVVAAAVALIAENRPVKLKVARDIMLINGIVLFSAVIPLSLDCPWMRRTNSHILLIAACGIGIVLLYLYADQRARKVGGATEKRSRSFSKIVVCGLAAVVVCVIGADIRHRQIVLQQEEITRVLSKAIGDVLRRARIQYDQFDVGISSNDDKVTCTLANPRMFKDVHGRKAWTPLHGGLQIDRDGAGGWVVQGTGELKGMRITRSADGSGMTSGPQITDGVTKPGQPPVFGPVIERGVKDALDLESGRVAEVPEAITEKSSIAENVIEAMSWVDREGLDVFADFGTVIVGRKMRVIAQDKGQWDALTASQVAALLDSSPVKAEDFAKFEAGDGGATYVFETGQGGRGILQVVGSDGVVKLRYKLVRTESDPKQAASAAIEAWLTLMDTGRHDQSWDTAAKSFRGVVTKTEWTAESEKIRRPLGEVVSRKSTTTQQVKTFPGMPDGVYCIAEFDTEFAGSQLAAEVVTFALEEDGQWRAIGYLIRPRTAVEQAVVAAARAWLESIDEGRYAESWSSASGLFHDALKQDKWVTALEKVRRPLGARVFRSADGFTTTTSLPGMPVGQYVTIQFNASFTGEKSAVETVTFVQEKDGGWRAVGYFIK